MRTIGKYEVLGLLGRGGMGAVYKVRIPVTRKIVALKLLRPAELLLDLLGPDRATRMFEAEAAAMAAFRHPNIAGIWDYGRDQRDRPFFIMEYYCDNLGAVIGETYRVEAPSRVLSLDRAAGYGLQVLAGLARLHHAGLVHRDIKPFNILLADDDTAKITDFGLSRLRGEGSEGPGLHGSLKAGSPYYAAPEQERDPGAAEPPADLYSVGVMLHRMLTGALPPEPGAPPGVPVRPSALNPDLNPDWDAFLARALAPDPADRFRTAPAMAADLSLLLARWRERVAAACGTGAPPRTPPGAPPLDPGLQRPGEGAALSWTSPARGNDSPWTPHYGDGATGRAGPDRPDRPVVPGTEPSSGPGAVDRAHDGSQSSRQGGQGSPDGPASSGGSVSVIEPHRERREPDEEYAPSMIRPVPQVTAAGLTESAVFSGAAAPGDIPYRPRSAPLRVGPDRAREVFGLDLLWRPAVYVDNDFLEMGETVADRATGLVWQRSGSPYVLTWEEAGEYVAGLNREGFAGADSWRLPTVAELAAILKPIPHGADFCSLETFDPAQRKLWSADRKSFCAAWYADVSLGFVGFQDFTCGCWVRAVRTLE